MKAITKGTLTLYLCQTMIFYSFYDGSDFMDNLYYISDRLIYIGLFATIFYGSGIDKNSGALFISIGIIRLFYRIYNALGLIPLIAERDLFYLLFLMLYLIASHEMEFRYFIHNRIVHFLEAIHVLPRKAGY